MNFLAKYKIRNTKYLKKIVAVFLILFLITGLWMKYFTNRAEAAWFDESFAYRKAITLTDSGAETNKYATLSSYDASDSTKYQPDCGDVRFTDSHGKLLKYTVSSCGATTTFHINMDAILSGSQTIYLYYGNPSASNGFISSDPYTACSGCSFGSPASEEKAPSPALYLKLDEGYGTTVHDTSSDKNDGTISGATWQNEDMCVSGKCLSFDGASSYVSIPDSNSTNITGSALTISTWVKLRNSGSYQRLISKDNGTNYYALLVQPNLAGFYYAFKTSSGGTDVKTVSYAISASAWYHVELVYTGTVANLYVNGQLIDSSTAITGTINSTAGTTLYLGKKQDNTQYLNGYLDEVKLYSFARTSDQVKADYTAGISKGGSVLGSSSQAFLSNGLVGYWKMDENSWNGTSGEVVDSSGNGNNGTGNNSVSTGTGKFGKSGSFDGLDDYINAGTSSSLDVTSNMTISAWVNSNSTTSTQMILARTDGSNGYEMWINPGASTETVGIWPGGPSSGNLFSSSYPMTTGTWHLVTVVFENGKATFYMNGQAVSSGSYTLNSPGTQTMYMGSESPGVEQFHGNIDEVRVYKRAFSPADVQSLYTYAPGPVEQWKFDEKTGSTVSDTTGVNTLTWSGSGSHWTTGKLGNAGKFNGSDDVLSKSSPTGLPTGNQARTISLWIKPDNSNPGGTLIHYGDGSGGGQEFVLSMITVSGTTYLFTDGVNAGNNISITGSQIPTSNTWNHIEFTFDGSAWNYYLNGALVKSGTFGTTINTATPTILNIGDRTDSPQTNYPGLIDNIKIYNYARTGKQVAEDMNNGYPATGSMIGYWKFDEGADNTCLGGTNDFCNSGTAGSVIDGLNVGTTRTLSGKYGKAITTNGSTTYAQIPDNDLIDFDVTQDYTVSFWMKDGGGNANQSSIVEKWDGGGGFPYSFRYNTGGIISFANYDGTRSSTVSSTASVNSGWHHVVGVHNVNTDKLYLYIDGVLQGSATDNLLTTSRNSSPVCIGGRCVSGFYWAGTVDELKIYNFALTSDDVKVDYNHGASQSFGSVGTDASGNPSNSADRAYCPPGDTTATCGPVGEWNFEEGQGGSVNDSSGNGNTGTWSGSGDPHWMSGKVGKAGNFNSSDDTVTVNDASSLQFGTGNFTISAWIYPRTVVMGASDQGTIISKNYTGFEYFVYQGNLNAYLGGTPNSLTGNKSLVPNQWYFVTLVRSGSTVTSYINAAQDAQVTNSSNVSNIGTNISIGQRTGNTTLAFDGKLDQVRVYNYARSGAQIAWDYNRGAPVAWWKMDECQGSTIHDAAAGGNDASVTIGGSGSQTSLGTCLTSGTAWGNGASGKLNSSLNLDGTDDFATVNSSNTAITGSLTVSAWIKPSSVAGSEIIAKGDAANFYRMKYSGGNMIFETFGLSNQDLTSVTAPPLGQWTHVTMVYDGSTKKIYINGKLDTSISVTGSITSGGVSTIYIGGFGFGSGEYFPGSLDDLRIYNYALTQAQINSLYNGGAAVRFGPSTGTP